MKNVIYEISCAGGAVYIGSAHNYANRIKAHLGELRRGTHLNLHLQAAFLKYGEHGLFFRIVEKIASRDELISAEQRHLDQAVSDGKRLMNICPKAGSRLGSKDRPETIEKRRMLAIGRRHTPESIELMRKIAKERGNNGVSKTPSFKAKLSARTRGKPNPRFREMIKTKGNRFQKGQQTRLGIKHTEATKRKISEKFRGYKWSPQALKNRVDAIREWWKTHEVSEATRAKISAHKTAYWAAKRAAQKE